MKKTKPKILVLHRQTTACGYYRQWIPSRYLASRGYDVTWDESKTYRERVGDISQLDNWARAYEGPFDLLLCDRALSWQEAACLAGVRHAMPSARMVVDTDDLFLDIPEWNHSKGKYQPGQECREAGLGHFRLAEMVTTSTPPLAKALDRYTHKTRVCYNAIDPADWKGYPVDPARKSDPCVRALYGGASGHYGDLDVVRKGLEAVIDKPPVPWRLICFGALPFWLHEKVRQYPGRVLSLPWAGFHEYPMLTAWGGIDIAIAPLAEHPFNEAKSDIKAQEAAIQRMAFLCSDVGPYATLPDAGFLKVANTPVQWAEALRALLTDAALRDKKTKAAEEWVYDTSTIDKRGHQWETIVEEALNQPRIEGLDDTRLPSEAGSPPEKSG